jgi:hypothetical protein
VQCEDTHWFISDPLAPLGASESNRWRFEAGIIRAIMSISSFVQNRVGQSSSECCDQMKPAVSAVPVCSPSH